MSESKPVMTYWWRTYAVCRIHPKIRVQIEMGEPTDAKHYESPADVIEQSVTLARLGRMLRKLAK